MESKKHRNFASLSTEKPQGRLAQLVQSVCLTSRGSGVRIPQRPHKPSATRKAFFISPTDTPGHNQPPDHHRNQPPTRLTTTAYSPDHHRIAVWTHGPCVPPPPDGPANSRIHLATSLFSKFRKLHQIRDEPIPSHTTFAEKTATHAKTATTPTMPRIPPLIP